MASSTGRMRRETNFKLLDSADLHITCTHKLHCRGQNAYLVCLFIVYFEKLLTIFGSCHFRLIDTWVWFNLYTWALGSAGGKRQRGLVALLSIFFVYRWNNRQPSLTLSSSSPYLLFIYFHYPLDVFHSLVVIRSSIINSKTIIITGLPWRTGNCLGAHLSL